MSNKKLQASTPPCGPMSTEEFLQELTKTDADRFLREDMAVAVLLNGHVPSHMREFIDVPIRFVTNSRDERRLVVRALPDYLSIGNDNDYMRIPLFPGSAQRVADAWSCVLPTAKLVTLLWASTRQQVPPQPWGKPYDASMMGNGRIWQHNARVEAKMKELGFSPTKGLVAGHKKDVVITNLLVDKLQQVAIYGWHQLSGVPIQPLYLGHESCYADYSHGIRLLSDECTLDGAQDSLKRVMQDPTLSDSVSNEGPLKVIRYSISA